MAEKNLASNNEHSEYSAALHKLLSRTTNPKLGLSRMNQLLSLLDVASLPAKIVQVVGTNGKGSSVAFLESLALAHGKKVGLFTSPHLCTAKERIRINGQLVSQKDFVKAAAVVDEKALQLADEASFFECMLAMALWLFKRDSLDVVILEAGLGGRLDATSAVGSHVLGVTMIDFDHQHILGHTLTAIAGEKIAAARPSQQVVTVPQADEVLAVIEAAAHTQGFKLTTALAEHRPLGLHGKHQQVNAGLALALLENVLETTHEEKIKQGLLAVNWPGRFEIVPQKNIVLDGAHNPSGIRALIGALKHHPQFSKHPLILVYGSLASEHAAEKIALLCQSGMNFVRVYLHEPANHRAQSKEDMRNLFLAGGFAEKNLNFYTSFSEIEDAALVLDAAIVISGSLYSVGAVRAEILNIPMDAHLPAY